MSVSRSTVSNLLQRQVQRWKFGKDFVRYLAIEDGKWTLDEFQVRFFEPLCISFDSAQ
jgi:hypothetical protein